MIGRLNEMVAENAKMVSNIDNIINISLNINTDIIIIISKICEMKDISLPNRNNFRNKPGATGVSVNPLGAFMDTAVLLKFDHAWTANTLSQQPPNWEPPSHYSKRGNHKSLAILAAV